MKPTEQPKLRVIFHIDMNKYYASVEQMLNPDLKGKAIAVCGSQDERHGIVLTASAEAKKAGVKTGMANWQARQACPGLIVCPPQYDQYTKYSRLARSIYSRYSNNIEPYGLDENWVDMSDICSSFEDAELLADEIRNTIKSELGLTVSIGVSFNKVFAKLGSDMKKPDAVTVLSPENWKERVWPLPVGDLLYVGGRTERKLLSRGIHTIGELAQYNVFSLKAMLGKNGVGLWVFANGMDDSRVSPVGYSRDVKNVSHGITCTQDVVNSDEVWRVILELSQDIGHRLIGYGLAAECVKLYIRRSKLGIEPGHQHILSYATQSPIEIAQEAYKLFLDSYKWQEPIRSICVSTGNLVPADSPSQLDIFGDAQRHAKRRAFDKCIDELRGRFGKHVIFSASLMCDLKMPDDGRHLAKMPGAMYR